MTETSSVFSKILVDGLSVPVQLCIVCLSTRLVFSSFTLQLCSFYCLTHLKKGVVLRENFSTQCFCVLSASVTWPTWAISLAWLIVQTVLSAADMIQASLHTLHLFYKLWPAGGSTTLAKHIQRKKYSWYLMYLTCFKSVTYVSHQEWLS